MTKMSLRRRLAVSLSTASLLVVTFVGSAFAANGVTAAITSGTLTASITNATLPSSTYSDTAQHVTGNLALSMADDRGLLPTPGWHVTVQSSAFVSGANSIPATAFSLTSADLPVMVTGQASDLTAFPLAGRTVAGLPLDTAVNVVSATAAYGAGSYTQALGVDLLIPAGAPVGTYAATVTVTIVSGA